jgi:hypothetical protein
VANDKKKGTYIGIYPKVFAFIKPFAMAKDKKMKIHKYLS